MVLLSAQGKKFRCRHCHLTIDEHELDKGYCPECAEASGTLHRDFDEIERNDDGTVHYCCELCGVSIEVR